jgi:O-antigen ligase
MSKLPTQFLTSWINFWVFIFSFSVLAINHFSGLPAIVLLFTAIFVITLKKNEKSKYELNRNEIIFIILIILFWLLNLTNTFFQPEGLEYENTRMALKAMDNPMRWILMLPIFFLLRRYKLDWRLISIGLSFGVFIAVGIASYEVYFLGFSRAQGGMNLIITFGQLMVVADMLLWVFMIFAWNNNNKVLATLTLIASIVAFYGSLLSVTRGAWLVYLFMIMSLVIFTLKRSVFNKKSLFSMPILLRIFLAFIVFFLVTQSSQYNVIKDQTTDTIKYVSSQGKSNVWGSEGVRIDIYKTAIEIARNYPFGVGTDNFRTGGKAVIILDTIENKNSYIEVKNENNKVLIHDNLMNDIHKYHYLQSFNSDGSIRFTSRMGHAHNEWLNVLAENGIAGFILLTSLFVFPLFIFWKNLSHNNDLVGMYSYCGILLTISFAIFGQTQAIFSSHATLIFFIFFIYLFIAQIYKLSNQQT